LFLVAVVVVVGPKGKAIESNKVHRIKSHVAGGGGAQLVATPTADPTDPTGGP
jgi:hypothetical protein